MPRFILASQSPRRRELLSQIGVKDFTILVPEADESYNPTLTPQEIVCAICRKKIEAAVELAKDDDAIIIAADTMVFLDDLRLGKPRNEEDAANMLRSLSGRTHIVCTGVSVARGKQIVTESETTAVRFRDLSDAEIAAYIKSGDPMDKAGSYGIQGKPALFVSGIEGDYFNVMGLPLHRLGQMLKKFDVDLFCEEARA